MSSPLSRMNDVNQHFKQRFKILQDVLVHFNLQKLSGMVPIDACNKGNWVFLNSWTAGTMETGRTKIVWRKKLMHRQCGIEANTKCEFKVDISTMDQLSAPNYYHRSVGTDVYYLQILSCCPSMSQRELNQKWSRLYRLAVSNQFWSSLTDKVNWMNWL